MKIVVTGCRLTLCFAALLAGSFPAVAGTPAPQGASVEGMAAIERIIRQSEYQMTWQDQTVLPDLKAAWHAPSRAHNLRFYFTEDGLRVVDRTAQDSPELLRLTVVGGLDGETEPAVLEATENRLEIRRGAITESYVNDQGGLQHILTINEKPPGGGPLVIELEWSAAGISLSDRAVEFRSASGRRLVYSGDQVHDATGAPLKLSMSCHGDRIRLTVSGPDPVFPITVKNLLTGAANTVLEGNVANLYFGGEVASGDLNGDGFADVVATAPNWDGGQVEEGAVLVFHGGPTGISSNGSGSIAAAANAIIESDVPYMDWPRRVAVVGDVNGDGYNDLAAGDDSWTPGNPPPPHDWWGAVWIFHGSVTGITAGVLADADAFIASDRTGASFGWGLQSAGDVNGDGFADLIASAWLWNDENPGQVSEGAAFVFHGSGAGITATLTNQANAVIEGNAPFLYAGNTVAGLGDVNGDGYDDVAVGMPFLDHPELNEGGIAILYGGITGIASNPTQALFDAADALIEANTASMNLQIVAGAGDVNGDGYGDVIIGNMAWGDLPAHNEEGVVVVFEGGPGGIESNLTTSFVVAADTVIEGNPNPHSALGLGQTIVAVGDTNGDGYADVAVGAYNYENGEVGEGAVFVFHGSPDGIPDSRTDPVEEAADVLIEGNMTGLCLEVTAAGDVNGDGYTDLVARAGFSPASPDTGEGAVLIYHGGAEGLADEPDGQYDSQQTFAHLGFSVASAGDIDGDGYSDLAVGAPNFDGGGQDTGRAYVFRGSPGPFLSTPADWFIDGDQVDGELGMAVASAGDVNGDGYGDLVIGTPYLSNPENEEGRIEVFHGSPSGLSTEADWFFESDHIDARIGWHVASAGDVDGDGYGDLIVGAPFYGDGQTHEGRAYVFFGSGQGLAADPGWTFESDVSDAELGTAVAGAGDVDGNGFADIIVGAPSFTSGEINEGAAYGFPGSASGLPDVPNWFIQTGRTDAHYGYSVAAAGDLNGDGIGDVIIGAPYDSNSESSEGRAYIYHGSPAGLPTVADQVLERNHADARFGESVAAAGDVNGDGFGDLIIGSPGYPSAAAQYGRAELFLGSVAGVVDQPVWSLDWSNAPSGLGSAVAGIGDHNGDGFSDVAVGVPWSNAGATYSGSVALFLGNAGAGRPVLARQLRGDDDPTPVQPWGLSHSGDAFQASMTATSHRGRELAKLHVEACPPGEGFGDVDCRHAVSMAWTAIPLGENGVVLTEELTGLTEGELYRWRAHVLFAPLHADEPGITPPPVPRHGPWRRLFAQAAATDIRIGQPQEIIIELVSLASSVPEGALQAEVDVMVTTSDGAPTDVDCSVDYATFNGTAFAGEDYVHASWNLYFPSGTASSTAQVIQVDLIGDTLDEADEDFLVELYNPMGAVLVPPTVHTVTILDDDPPPGLSAADIQVDEGVGLAVVQLELSAPTAFEVTVAYGTVDGSAMAPGDFIHVGGTASIPPLDTLFLVEIPVEDDWLEEGAETFTLELWSPSNVVLMTAEVTVTIYDNDAGILFADGFESEDSTAWSSTMP